MGSSDIASYISLGLLGVLGLFAIISALIGLGRKLKKTIGSTVVIVLSAVIAFIITALAFGPSSSLLGSGADALANALHDSDFADIIGLESVSGALSTYACMILSPFIFILLFLLIRLVLGIVMRIVIKFIPILNNIPKVASRLGGLGVGLINGILLCMIIFMPLLGTVGIVNNVMDTMVENGTANGEDIEDAEIVLDAVVEDGAGGVMYNCSKFLYNGLTSTKYNGEKVNLEEEISVVLTMSGDITSASEDDIMVVAVDSVYYGVEKSPIIRSFAAELVAKMSDAWNKGETFLGMSKPDLDDKIDPVIDALLEIFATETDKTITADLECVNNFLQVADKHGIIGTELDTDKLIDKFSKEGVLEELIHTLDGNDRMVAVIDEVNFLVVRIFADELDMPENSDEFYDNLISDLNGIMAEYRLGFIDRAEAKKKILDTLERYAIDPSSNESDSFAENLLDSALDENIPDGAGLSRDDVRGLGSAIVTAEDLLGYMGKYSDVSDKNKEAKEIDDVMVSLVNVLKDLDLNADQIHAADIMELMGETLDNMAETDTYGKITDKLIVAVMQSDKISDSIGLSVYEMTDFANQITNGRKNNTGYKEISHTLANSIAVFENIDNNQSKSEKIEAIIKNITPETAEVVQNIATPSLMKNYGVKEEHADKASEAVGTLFGNMSDFKQNHPDATEEDEKREAEAVNKIITIAVKATKDDSHTNQYFSTNESDGHLDMSAYDVVDLFATSSVASDTLDDILVDEAGESKDDPMGIQKGINNADKAELQSALKQYSEDNSDDEDIQNRLDNIGSLFGVEFRG